jgi:hypothetical protein
LACCYYEGKGIKQDVRRALKLFRSTIELFNKYEGNSSISNEPDYITKSRQILVNNGYKSEVNKLKKAAEQGDKKAIGILEEAGIEFVAPKHSTTIPNKVADEPIMRETPKRELPIDIIVGENVTHKTLGDGIVRESNDGYICVEFAAGKKKFLNPEAFNDGFLSRDI